MTESIIVLFEDQDIVVIAKPGGMVTNRARSLSSPTLQDWFDSYVQGTSFPNDWQKLLPEDFSDEYGTPEEIFSERQGMVHRLDKDTSGVMVFAKHPGSLLNLLTQFRTRGVQKEYVALVHGKFRVEQGMISAPLARSRTNRQKFAIDIEGRAAVTQYSTEKTFEGFEWKELSEKAGEAAVTIKKEARLYNAGFSLVRCLPKTGRTHQIRVHLAHEQHPIVGDEKYVGRRRTKIDPLWCPRQFLHAAALEFTHPRTQERVRFVAELPEDLKQVIGFLAV
jgi:23S rRNA pseudouridine1911/1915/1917 synthase